MTTLTPDIERIDSLIAWAEKEYRKKLDGLPSEWSQHIWADVFNSQAETAEGCGTACCIAGKVAIEDGATALKLKEDNYWGIAASAWTYPEPDLGWEGYASQALGLSPLQAMALFHENNSITDLRAARDLIANDDTHALEDWADRLYL